MSFLGRLLPKEDKFFNSIRALSVQSQTAASILKDFVESDNDGERQSFGHSLAQCKAESKKISEQITKDLSLSFITPFDREDIQDLTSNLYKIPKTIDKIRERMELHGLKSAQGDFSRQLELIVQEASAMQDIIDALTRKGAAKTVVDKVAELHELENRGDELLGEMLVSLFEEDNNDIRNLILRKDIYDMLEKVLDRYRDAAGIALQIVFKHS
jgi:hypothetical protein